MKNWCCCEFGAIVWSCDLNGHVVLSFVWRFLMDGVFWYLFELFREVFEAHVYFDVVVEVFEMSV